MKVELCHNKQLTCHQTELKLRHCHHSIRIGDFQARFRKIITHLSVRKSFLASECYRSHRKSIKFTKIFSTYDHSIIILVFLCSLGLGQWLQVSNTWMTWWGRQLWTELTSLPVILMILEQFVQMGILRRRIALSLHWPQWAVQLFFAKGSDWQYWSFSSQHWLQYLYCRQIEPVITNPRLMSYFLWYELSWWLLAFVSFLHFCWWKWLPFASCEPRAYGDIE